MSPAVAVSLRPNEFFLNQTFLCNEVRGDFAELFTCGFNVFDDSRGENVGVDEVVGFFEAFASEREEVETRKELLILSGP